MRKNEIPRRIRALFYGKCVASTFGILFWSSGTQHYIGRHSIGCPNFARIILRNEMANFGHDASRTNFFKIIALYITMEGPL